MLIEEQLPDVIREKILGYRLQPMTRDYESPSQLYRVSKPRNPTLFLKVAPKLRREEERLRWLEGSDETLLQSGTSLISAIADALQTLHQLPIDHCPFSASVDALLQVAVERVEHGRLDSNQFPASYQGLSIDELLELLLRLRPEHELKLVFTHGDPSLVNILFSDGKFSGFVDLGLAGVGDPFRDLAIASRSIALNMGGRWIKPFVQAYGAPLDVRRLQFYTLLDEFVMDRPT